ncbi:tripartite tricarboxylate transporter TctB family protein [Virgibacillus kimchii]
MAANIGNYLLLIIIGAFGLYYFLDVRSLPNPQERVIVEILFWVLVVLLAIEASRTTYKLWKENKNENNKQSIKSILKGWILNKPVMLFVGLSLYILLLPIIGFFVTSAIFLVTYNYLLGSKKLWELTLLPIAILISVYILFVLVLDVRLPDGFLI